MIPSRFTLGVRRLVSEGKDAHGNTVTAHADAVNWPVRQIDPGAMAEPFEARRDASVVVYTIHADPHPNTPTVRDLVVVDGIEYAVEGEPKDWTRGPWPNPVAGIVVELRNVEG